MNADRITFNRCLTIFQLEDLKEKLQSVEKFAKETADKYTELASHQKNTKQKQITQLKESNTQLKNVSYNIGWSN